MESVSNRNTQQTNTGMIFVALDERYLEDPISCEFFVEPVIDPHGCTFERKEIELIIDKTQKCPMTQQP